jgi:hypothetical protein
MAAAEAGFRRVLAHALASAQQRARAEAGLLAARGLRAPEARAEIALAPLPRSDWGALKAVPLRMDRQRGPFTRITVHHSAEATRELGRGTKAEVAAELRLLQKVHMKDRGFGDIGYHFLIDPDGRVWQGRALEYQGAHAAGANNVDNLGLCLLGDFERERPDGAALAALERLVEDLRRRFRIPKARVFGHLELTATLCPGNHLMSWVARYRGGMIRTAAAVRTTAPNSAKPSVPGRIR